MVIFMPHVQLGLVPSAHGLAPLHWIDTRESAQQGAFTCCLNSEE